MEKAYTQELMAEYTLEENNQLMLEGVNKALNSLREYDRPRLAERIFALVFVPIFAGEESQYNASIETWIQFAGSPYREVDVVDAKGNVLFTVPPLFNRDNVYVNPKRKTSIFHIVTTANQFSRIHPNQGKHYLINEMQKQAMTMEVPSNVVENLTFWNGIFKRYGRPEIAVNNNDTHNSNHNENGFNPDEFESL